MKHLLFLIVIGLSLTTYAQKAKKGFEYEHAPFTNESIIKTWQQSGEKITIRPGRNNYLDVPETRVIRYNITYKGFLYPALPYIDTTEFPPIERLVHYGDTGIVTKKSIIEPCLLYVSLHKDDLLTLIPANKIETYRIYQKYNIYEDILTGKCYLGNQYTYYNKELYDVSYTNRKGNPFDKNTIIWQEVGK